MREFFALISRSWIGLVGAALTTISAVLFVSLFAMNLVGFEGGPYSGILSFLVIPMVFIFGLLLIPLGVWRQRRREAKNASEGKPPLRAPVLDFNLASTRKAALIVFVLTIVNLSLVAAATYKGVAVMDSVSFCGETCHTVMSPEFATYQRSPHSRVKCTECHIGEGASWFVKSKLSGSWQLVSVALNLYPKPIPTPVHNLRPARETCEQCHWPTKFIGERLRVRHRYAEDETNTDLKNVYLLNVGGIKDGQGKGIHWHVDPNVNIRYRSDPKREKIHEVELKTPEGTRLYTSEEPAPADLDSEWRTMDCIDCHNRPTHVYQYPKEAMDQALELGELDRSLPFIKREGLRVIQLPFESNEAAKAGIKKALFEFYEKEYPDLVKSEGKKLDAAAEALYVLYARNVFPQMNIQWGTYPNFAYEHVGCFRCHDKKHATESGEKISKSCEGCHTMLASEEEEPEILEILNP